MSRIFLIFMICLVSFGADAATLLHSVDFESGTLTGLQPHLNGKYSTGTGASVTVVQSPVGAGVYAGKYDLVYDGGSYRAETYLDPYSKGVLAFGTEYWFGFRYRYDAWSLDSDAEIAPFQIHETPGTWDPACASSAFAVAPILMSTGSDVENIFTFGSVKRYSAPMNKGAWQTITVRIIPSTGASGIIEVWKDGVKLFTVSGQNAAAKDKCNQNTFAPFYNMGVYKWNWASKATQSTRRTLIIDDFKLASGPDGYALVTPGGAPVTDTTPPLVSAVQVSSVATDGATLLWTTDEASNSAVEYGLTSAYGSTASNAAQSSVTAHSVTLTGLTPNTLYHYRVKSVDAAGNIGLSADMTLTTDALPPTIPGEVFSDVFGRTDGAVVGNGWVETETAAAAVALSSGKLFWADASDESYRPVVSHSFTKLSTNRLEWRYTMDWTRFQVESVYELRMQLGDGAIMGMTDYNAGVGVNLIWQMVSGVHNTLGTVDNGVVTGRGVVAGNTDIVVTADLDANTYEVKAAGVVIASGVPFDNVVDIDTVRFFTNNLNEANFTGRTIDNVYVIDLGPPPDTTSPQFSAGPVVNDVVTSAAVIFTTNEPTTAVVDFGLASLTNQAADNILTTDHCVTLPGLLMGRDYAYRVTATDAAGNALVGSVLPFTAGWVEAACP